MTCNDYDIGPFVEGCRGGFDFTLLFENTVLSAGPSCTVLFAALARITYLYRRQTVVAARSFWMYKLAAIVAYAAMQPVILGVGRHSQWGDHWSFTLSGVLCLVNIPVFGILSFLEHSKSPRPSTMFLAYLAFSTLFDVVRTRTSWLISMPIGLQISFLISTALKFVVMTLEAVEKGRFLSGAADNCPELTSSIFNRLTFFWLNRLLWLGAKRTLLADDLYDLDSELQTSKVAILFSKALQGSKEDAARTSVSAALFKVLRWKILATIPPRLCLLGCTICSPILLRTLLDYLQDSSRVTPGASGYGLILGFALLYFGIALSTGLYWYHHYRVLVLVRGCLVSAIGRKAGSVNMALADDPQANLTLMSSDVERIFEGFRFAHELWASLIQAVIAAYLLQRQVGVASTLPPIVLVIACSALSGWISHVSNHRLKGWMQELQVRIGVSSTTLLSLRGIKMRGLEGILCSIIRQLRMRELREANRYRFLGVWAVVSAWIPELLAPSFTFLIFIASPGTSRGRLVATTAFTTLSLLQVLALPLNSFLQNLPSLVATIGCLSRIDDFLALEDWSDRRIHHDGAGKDLPFAHGNQVELGDMVSQNHSDSEAKGIQLDRASFAYQPGAYVLKEINATIPVAKLTCVVGPVASGKSTFCRAIIGELSAKIGTVTTPSASYNISYCSQHPFIRDRTVKENIVMYSDYDAAWYNKVIEACALRDSLSAMPDGDRTATGSDGARLSGGQKQKIAIARALYARNPIMVCDDIFSGLDAFSAWHIFQHVFAADGLARGLGTTVIFATHTVRFLPYTDQIIVLRADGTIGQCGSYESLRASTGYIKTLPIDSANGKPRKGEELGNPLVSGETNGSISNHHQPAALQGEFSLYTFYFKTMKIWTFILLPLVSLLFTVVYLASSYWLKIWTEHVSGTVGQYTFWGVYTGFLLTALLLLGLSDYFFSIHAATQAGISLHDRILQTTLDAPWSFLSQTSAGAILNRLSQDLQLIDGELPLSLQNLVLTLILAAGQAILITIAAPFVGVAFPLVIGVLYLVQKFYLKTSRQLRLLDLEAKSPLYTHFMELLKGSSTIRAFGWKDRSIDAFIDLAEHSQKPMHLLNMAQRWLTFVLDIIVAIIAVLTVTVAVTLRSESGSIGVALTQVMSTSLILRTIIITWTRVEISLGAVARIQEFATTTPSETQERPRQDIIMQWPDKGQIEFTNLTASYKSMPGQPALKDINVVFRGGQKIGICGGSGSGKSSMVLALLHMLEFESGTIEIDGVDISGLPRQQLRRAINSVPQDPLLIAGSIRLNMDPESQATDDQLVQALEKVGLSDIVTGLGGIYANMNVDVLSSGQQQLFALACATLHRSKVVLIDEATSKTDHDTDERMQRIISREFAECTVITIAHRLETVMGHDYIAVLGDGRVLECDTPGNLLARDSQFRRMLGRGDSESGTATEFTALSK